MHAFWNLILKKAQDKAVAVMSIFFSSLPLALVGLWVGGLPKVTALPVILLSAILQTGYSISLFKAYDRGQLSSVYPVARGSAPVFIFIASYIFLDPEISVRTFVGILIIFGDFEIRISLWRRRLCFYNRPCLRDIVSDRS